MPPIKLDSMNDDPTAWDYVKNINDIDTPFLVIYLEPVRHNLALAINLIVKQSELTAQWKMMARDRTISI